MASKFHLSSGGIIDFNSSAVTLTHSSDGLTLNSTKKLMFNQSSAYIFGSGDSDTILNLVSGNEIDLTAGTIDINGKTTIDNNSENVATIIATNNIGTALQVTGTSMLAGNVTVTGNDLTVFGGDTSLGGATTISKNVNGEFVGLTLINEHDASSSDGSISLRFDLEDTSGNAVDSGKIAVKKENVFTSTGTTQNSSMVFSTSADGTLTEYMTLSSVGNLTLTGAVSAVINSENVSTATFTQNGSGYALFASGTSLLAGNVTVTGGATTISKDTDAEFVALTLTNQSDSNNTNGLVSLRFDLEDTSGNAVDSGKIAVKKENVFTSTGTTQDSSMVFSTSINGTLTERMTLSSSGALSLNGGTLGDGQATDGYCLSNLSQTINDTTTDAATYTMLKGNLTVTNGGSNGVRNLIDFQTIQGAGDTFSSVFKVSDSGYTTMAGLNVGSNSSEGMSTVFGPIICTTSGIPTPGSFGNSSNGSSGDTYTTTTALEALATSSGASDATEAFALDLYNTDVSATARKVSMKFITYVSGDTFTTVNSGKITVSQEQAFTTTGTTQDSSMGFFTTLNGTLTERMTLKSDGALKIGGYTYTFPTTGATNDYVLKATNVNTNAATVTLAWTQQSGGGGSSTLAGLTDVVTSTDESNFTKSIVIGTSNAAPTISGVTGADSNIFIGNGGGGADTATFAITSGDNNIVLGNSSFGDATEASNNIVLGVGCLATNTATTASNNVVIGDGAAATLISGDRNVLIGKSAGAALTVGDTVAIGKSAAGSTTVGLYNTAVGHESLNTNVDGGRNTAIGYNSLYSMEPGTAQTGHNTAVGYNAGIDVSTGTKNTFLGSETGTNLGSLSTTGTLDANGTNGTTFTLENTKVSSDHQFNGNYIKFTSGNNIGEARVIKTTTDDGDAIVTFSAFSNTPAQNDTYEIYSQTVAHSGTLAALGTNTTVVLEAFSGVSSVDDFYNDVIIKFDSNTTTENLRNVVRLITDYTGSSRTATVDAFPNSEAPASGDTYKLYAPNTTTGAKNTFLGYGSGGLGINDNQTSIGFQAGCSAANQVTLGNSDITALRCSETTIATLSDSRDKTNVSNSTYGLSFINSLRPVQYTWNRRHIEQGDETSLSNGKTRVGFLAQELLSAMPNNENEILDLVYDVNPERLEAKYGNLIPIMAKAIQDLSAANEALVARVTALENA